MAEKCCSNCCCARAQQQNPTADSADKANTKNAQQAGVAETQQPNTKEQERLDNKKLESLQTGAAVSFFFALIVFLGALGLEQSMYQMPALVQLILAALVALPLTLTGVSLSSRASEQPRL